MRENSFLYKDGEIMTNGSIAMKPNLKKYIIPETIGKNEETTTKFTYRRLFIKREIDELIQTQNRLSPIHTPDESFEIQCWFFTIQPPQDLSKRSSFNTGKSWSWIYRFSPGISPGTSHIAEDKTMSEETVSRTTLSSNITTHAADQNDNRVSLPPNLNCMENNKKCS